jgi:hypothetical protein
MRRGVLALTLGAFALWAGVKAVPFLGGQRAEIFATPAVQATDPSALALVGVKKHQRVCVNGIEYGPAAKYVSLSVKAKRPSGTILLEAKARGYEARARHPAGLIGDVPIVLPIAPARSEVDGGTLCLTNEGRHQVSFYAINPGRGSSPAQTTVDSKPVMQQMSVTLLTSPSKSMASRMGEIFGHVAAFRPVTGWEVWLLALLAFIGVPVALGVALARAAAADDEAPPPDYESARR